MISPLGQHWLEAAHDLGFKVTAPFTPISDSGVSFFYDALVHDFGSPKGRRGESRGRCRHGYGYSCMSGGGPYDRESTIEVLQDWGWEGEGSAPEWLGSQ
jgi:hypothetical protein